jgi:type I restriction enzyme S subunit
MKFEKIPIDLSQNNISNDWKLFKLKYLARIQFSNVDKITKDGEEEIILCNYTDVYKNDVITSNIDFMKASASQEEISKFGLTEGDVLITKDSETADDIGIPAYISEKIEKLVCGYHLSILHPHNNIDGKYLFRFLSSQIAASYFETRANGITRFAIGLDAVGSCPILFPSLLAQKSIATFLDLEIACIDAQIAKKERQIELLQEKRQAIITRAVTKGLDPSAKMKDSGVEWIGEIPEGWEIRRLKFIASLKSGNGITTENIQDDGLYPVYGGNGVRGYTNTYTHNGDFVLIGRQGALCGNINYAHGKFWASEHAIVATPVIELDTIWLGEILKVMNLNQYSISAAQPGLAIDRIVNLFMPVPPYSEQKKLSFYFNRTLNETDNLVELINTSISLLREYRSALITATVSGQIDVSKEIVP